MTEAARMVGLSVRQLRRLRRRVQRDGRTGGTEIGAPTDTKSDTTPDDATSVAR